MPIDVEPLDNVYTRAIVSTWAAESGPTNPETDDDHPDRPDRRRRRRQGRLRRHRRRLRRRRWRWRWRRRRLALEADEAQARTLREQVPQVRAGVRASEAAEHGEARTTAWPCQSRATPTWEAGAPVTVRTIHDTSPDDLVRRIEGIGGGQVRGVDQAIDYITLRAMEV